MADGKKTEPVAEPAKPVFEEMWRQDGKRFQVSLQDIKEKNKYKQVYESDDKNDAIEEAQEQAIEHGQVVIVWDRKLEEKIKTVDVGGGSSPPPEPPKKGKK